MLSTFTVEFVREFISLGTFTQSEVFHVHECWPGALTMEALQLLIRHCPLLNRIEGMRFCPRVRHLIPELRKQMLRQTFDLVIEN
jgi:hypothetical protein